MDLGTLVGWITAAGLGIGWVVDTKRKTRAEQREEQREQRERNREQRENERHQLEMQRARRELQEQQDQQLALESTEARSQQHKLEEARVTILADRSSSERLGTVATVLASSAADSFVRAQNIGDRGKAAMQERRDGFLKDVCKYYRLEADRLFEYVAHEADEFPDEYEIGMVAALAFDTAIHSANTWLFGMLSNAAEMLDVLEFLRDNPELDVQTAMQRLRARLDEREQDRQSERDAAAAST